MSQQVSARTLRLLRQALHTLYPTDADARRVIHDAELNDGAIIFGNSAQNNWHAILIEARKNNEIGQLLEVALGDYPDNAPLQSAAQAYNSDTHQREPESEEQPPPKPKKSLSEVGPSPSINRNGRSWYLSIGVLSMGVLIGVFAVNTFGGLGAFRLTTPEPTSTDIPDPAATNAVSGSAIVITPTDTMASTNSDAIAVSETSSATTSIAFATAMSGSMETPIVTLSQTRNISITAEVPQPIATLVPTVSSDALMPNIGVPMTVMPPETLSPDGMIYIPAGAFIIGKSENVSEGYLPEFYIDIYEVTNEEFAECVDNGPCTRPEKIASNTVPRYYEQKGDYPVIYVDWHQAKTYCEWIGKDLPTEDQWLRAARGSDERTYPWGEGIDCTRANYGVCQYKDTTKSGSYPLGVSPYGVHDMSGNVWEWTNRDEISASLQGGSWRNREDLVSTTSILRRDSSRDSYLVEMDVGFRCVIDTQ